MEKKSWDSIIERIYQHYHNECKLPNKGIQFEFVVEMLLHTLFDKEELYFTGTKLSHDGSKDFWAIDAAQQLWWAECKNYSEKISLQQLAPTLIMAELNESSYLLFFSYTDLNKPLKRKIGQYAVRHKKQIRIYAGSVLEYWIAELWNKIAKDSEKLKITKPENNLNIDCYHEKNSQFINKEYYTGYTSFDEIRMGEVYNLNIVLQNLSISSSASVRVEIIKNPDLYNFEIMAQGQKVEYMDVCLLPFELKHIQFMIRPIAYKEKLEFPGITIHNEFNGTSNEFSEPAKVYSCTQRRQVVYQGEQYDQLRKRFIQASSSGNGFAFFLLYGPSGSGKTRATEECIAIYSQKGYFIYDFIHFNRNTEWKDIIKELVYSLFNIPHDLALDIIISDLSNPETPRRHEHENVIIDLFSILCKKDVSAEALFPYYTLIFEKMQEQNFLIAIDNIQDYAPEVLGFLQTMLNYFFTIQRPVRGTLLAVLNTSKIYDPRFSQFLAEALEKQTDLKHSFEFPPITCEFIHGFSTVYEAQAFLMDLLQMHSLSIYDKSLKELLKSAAYRPKQIQLLADNLQLHGFKPAVRPKHQVELFRHLVQEIPQDYQKILEENYRVILQKYKLDETQVKLHLALLDLFEQMNTIGVSALNLNSDIYFILEKHGLLHNLGSKSEFNFVFDHDLIAQCICNEIYSDFTAISAGWVYAHKAVFQARLKISKHILQFCEIKHAKISYIDFNKIESDIHIDTIPPRLQLRMCEAMVERLIQFKNLMDLGVFILRAKKYCIYVCDHISEVASLPLFSNVYLHINNLTPTDQSEWEEYFSFLIHFCEVRVHVGTPPLKEYRILYTQLSEALKKNYAFSKELNYAKAYVHNRIFNLGKTLGDYYMFPEEWKCANQIGHRYRFYDILFENYFNRANLYLQGDIYIRRTIKYLKKGFKCYHKCLPATKEKFRVNYNSKYLLFLLLTRQYQAAISFADDALNNLKYNNSVNYHLFFQNKFLRYKLYAILLDRPINSDILRVCMNRYREALSAIGQYNSLDHLFLEANCAFFLGSKQEFVQYFLICCDSLSALENKAKNENAIMIDLAYKYRLLGLCSPAQSTEFIPARFTEARFICSCTERELQDYILHYKPVAPFFDSTGWNIFFM